jgi:phospholipid/cholesterol/gamma-HCH transport system ATP-binding protein
VGGAVTVEGRTWRAVGREELYALRRRMGMLFQFGALFTDMSRVRQRGLPAARAHRPARRLINDLVLMKLHAVGLRGAAQLTQTSSPAAWRGAWRWRARSRSTRCC